jgi:hypothetical protein
MKASERNGQQKKKNGQSGGVSVYIALKFTLGRDSVTGSSIEPITLLTSIPDNSHILEVQPFGSGRIQKLAETFGSEKKSLGSAR